MARSASRPFPTDTRLTARCWLGCALWEQLGLGEFWREKLPPSREGTRWEKVLQTLVLYRLIDPGSEWRLHRHWFDHTAIADLLGRDFSLAEPSAARQFYLQLTEVEQAFKELTRSRHPSRSPLGLDSRVVA